MYFLDLLRNDHITLENSQQFDHIEDLFQGLEDTNCEVVKVNPNSHLCVGDNDPTTVTLKGEICKYDCDDLYSYEEYIPFTIEILKAQWDRFQSEFVC